MGKLLLEMALFAGILCQIAMLTSAKQNVDISETKNSLNSARIEAMYSGKSYTMDPSQITPAQRNATILQEMARREAERIVRTGDYESFYNRLKNNKALLPVMDRGL